MLIALQLNYHFCFFDTTHSLPINHLILVELQSQLFILLQEPFILLGGLVKLQGQLLTVTLQGFKSLQQCQ